MAGTEGAENAGPRMSGPIMKQPTFDCSAKDKYVKLQNFKLEVKCMLQNFNIRQMERILIIKNQLDRQGLQLLETLTQVEQEACNDEEGLFEILNKNLKPQYSETIKSLQFQNIVRQLNESAEEQTVILRTTSVQCNYKEVDRQLKKHFIHRINDLEMLTDIIKAHLK